MKVKKVLKKKKVNVVGAPKKKGRTLSRLKRIEQKLDRILSPDEEEEEEGTPTRRRRETREVSWFGMDF